MTVSNLLRSTLAILAIAAPVLVWSAPKKLLVITVTTGFRHSSIETAEKVLKDIGEKSGAWTVDYVHQPEGQPKNPGRPPEKKPTIAMKPSRPNKKPTAKHLPNSMPRTKYGTIK